MSASHGSSEEWWDTAPYPGCVPGAATAFGATEAPRQLGPDDRGSLWQLDFHCPRGLPPLSLSLLGDLCAGAQRAARDLRVAGSGGLVARLVGPRVYLGALPAGAGPHGSPRDAGASDEAWNGFADEWSAAADELVGTYERLGEALGRVGPGSLGVPTGKQVPGHAVPRELAQEQSALREVEPRTLLGCLAEAREVHAKAWQVHFSFMYRLLAPLPELRHGLRRAGHRRGPGARAAPGRGHLGARSRPAAVGAGPRSARRWARAGVPVLSRRGDARGSCLESRGCRMGFPAGPGAPEARRAQRCDARCHFCLVGRGPRRRAALGSGAPGRRRSSAVALGGAAREAHGSHSSADGDTGEAALRGAPEQGSNGQLRVVERGAQHRHRPASSSAASPCRPRARPDWWRARPERRLLLDLRGARSGGTRRRDARFDVGSRSGSPGVPRQLARAARRDAFGPRGGCGDLRSGSRRDPRSGPQAACAGCVARRGGRCAGSGSPPASRGVGSVWCASRQTCLSCAGARSWCARRRRPAGLPSSPESGHACVKTGGCSPTPP